MINQISNIYIDSCEPQGSSGSFRLVADKLNESLTRLNLSCDKGDANFYGITTASDFRLRNPYANNFYICAWEFPTIPNFILRNAHNKYVIGISKQVYDSYKLSGFNNVDYILLGCDENEWFIEEVEKNDVFTFFTDNHSNARSGFESLIPSFAKAFENRSDVQLYIKDRPSGQIEGFINHYVDKYNVKIIYDKSFYTLEELRKLYNKCDCFVYTNNIASFGMPPLQALFCKKPVLATRASSLVEFLKDDYSYLVEPKIVDFDSNYLRFLQSCGFKNYAPLNWYRQIPKMTVPKQDDTIDKLRYIYNNLNEANKKAEIGYNIVRKEFTWNNSAKKLSELLNNKYGK